MRKKQLILCSSYLIDLEDLEDRFVNLVHQRFRHSDTVKWRKL